MAEILPALNPTPGVTNFPVPDSVQLAQPGGGLVTFEGPWINGQQMPGQWLLTKAAREFGIQIQQGAYLTGAKVIPLGDPLMPIEYEVRIWEDAAMGMFRRLLQTLLKKPLVPVPGTNGVTSVLGIDDPALKDLGVTQVIVKNVNYPKNPLITSGGKGAWIGKVEFLEYRGTPVKAQSPPSQTLQDRRAGIPGAQSNVDTVNAALTQGATQTQNALANRVIPRR